MSLMTPEQTYLENLRTIDRIAVFVARKHHVNPDETAEFTQVVRVKLIENEYAIIRKYEGLSLLSTYLTTCITRLYCQWRDEQWGKWRPSAEAKRIGNKAIVLERYMWRDGYTFEEAVNVLTTPQGAQYTRAELEAIYVRLPRRNPRPVMVSDDILPETVAVEAEAEELAGRSEREESARHAVVALDGLLTSMDAEDRLLLKLRFWYAQKVSDIAQTLQIDQKKLYKRLDKLFGRLRQGLELAGVNKSDIGTLLAPGDQELHLDLFRETEISSPGPSHPSGGKGVRGSRGVLR